LSCSLTLMEVACSPLNLKMVAICSSRGLDDFHWTTQCYILEENTLYYISLFELFMQGFLWWYFMPWKFCHHQLSFLLITNKYWNLSFYIKSTEYMNIVTGKPVHVDSLGTESNTHVAISPLTDYFHFKIIKTTGSWDRMCCSDTGSIFVRFTMTWKRKRFSK
jgi:hypothetical protein